MLTTETLLSSYRKKTPQSAAQFARASRTLPGGVSRNTVFRVPHPIYMEGGDGKFLHDIDGNSYVDFVMNYGPILLGHASPQIMNKLRDELMGGLGLGAPTCFEAEVAELALSSVPGLERIRFTNSGTEAVFHMIRAARAITGRERIIKFEGAYHGSQDSVMQSVIPPVGSAAPPWFSVPDSEGIPSSQSREVLSVPYNDLDALNQCLLAYPGEIAAVILDPGMNRCGLPQPEDDFLQEMARMIRDAGALLLFDEIVTGFRYSRGGAQDHFGLQADLVAYGKCLGGGAPIGALAGSAEMMSVFDLDLDGHARVPHSGTFNATPLSLAAASAFLNYVNDHPDLYDQVDQLGEQVRRGINALGERLDVPILGTGAHSMFQVHYGIRKLKSYPDFARRDIRFRHHLYWFMAVNGIYVPPSGTFFFSTVHTEADAQQFLQCLETFMEEYYLPLSA